MNVDFMRAVDYYAGVPLCFLATWWLRLARAWRRPPGHPPRRVLWVELSEMGSAILADPAMRKLARDSGAELYFVIFARNAKSLRLLDTVPAANVFTLRENTLPGLVTDALRFARWARRTRIDTVIDLELFSRVSALLSAASGAGRRVGFHAFHNEGLYRGDLLTHAVAYNPHQHIAKNFVALVNAALSARAEVPYSKTVIGDEEIELAQARVDAAASARVRASLSQALPGGGEGRRLVLLNPNAGDLLPQRRWRNENFAAVGRALIEEFADVIVLITGAPAERAGAETLRLEIDHPRCANFAGCVAFEDLPALYAMASAMLTNDSGPGHFAAVTRLRTVVLFGPETPALYGPLGNTDAVFAGLACSPCVSAANHRKTPCRDNVCLQVITPEQVLARLRAALGQSRV